MSHYLQGTQPTEATSLSHLADGLRTPGDTVPYLNAFASYVRLSVGGQLSTISDKSPTHCTPVARRSKQTAGLDLKQWSMGVHQDVPLPAGTPPLTPGHL